MGEQEHCQKTCPFYLKARIGFVDAIAGFKGVLGGYPTVTYTLQGSLTKKLKIKILYRNLEKFLIGLRRRFELYLYIWVNLVLTRVQSDRSCER